MARPAQLQPKRQPSQGRQLLLLNTKRPENRGSRQIFCPTQPVRAKFFRHVSELWTWSMGRSVQIQSQTFTRVYVFKNVVQESQKCCLTHHRITLQKSMANDGPSPTQPRSSSGSRFPIEEGGKCSTVSDPIFGARNTGSHMLSDVTHTFWSEDRGQDCAVRPVAMVVGSPLLWQRATWTDQRSQRWKGMWEQ